MLIGLASAQSQGCQLKPDTLARNASFGTCPQFQYLPVGTNCTLGCEQNSLIVSPPLIVTCTSGFQGPTLVTSPPLPYEFCLPSCPLPTATLTPPQSAGTCKDRLGQGLKCTPRCMPGFVPDTPDSSRYFECKDNVTLEVGPTYNCKCQLSATWPFALGECNSTLAMGQSCKKGCISGFTSNETSPLTLCTPTGLITTPYTCDRQVSNTNCYLEAEAPFWAESTVVPLGNSVEIGCDGGYSSIGPTSFTCTQSSLAELQRLASMVICVPDPCSGVLARVNATELSWPQTTCRNDTMPSGATCLVDSGPPPTPSPTTPSDRRRRLLQTGQSQPTRIRKIVCNEGQLTEYIVSTTGVGIFACQLSATAPFLVDSPVVPFSLSTQLGCVNGFRAVAKLQNYPFFFDPLTNIFTCSGNSQIIEVGSMISCEPVGPVCQLGSVLQLLLPPRASGNCPLTMVGGQSCFLSCAAGYSTGDSTEVTCSAQGVPTFPFFSCSAVPAPTAPTSPPSQLPTSVPTALPTQTPTTQPTGQPSLLPTPAPNCSVSASPPFWAQASSVGLGQRVQIGCVTGFDPNDNKTHHFQCTEAGRAVTVSNQVGASNIASFSCVQGCSAVLAVLLAANTAPAAGGNCTDYMRHASFCQVPCLPSYSALGSTTFAVCFNGSIQLSHQCKLSDQASRVCSAVAVPPYRVSRSSVREGLSATISCDPGFSFSGTDHLFCFNATNSPVWHVNGSVIVNQQAVMAYKCSRNPTPAPSSVPSAQPTALKPPSSTPSRVPSQPSPPSTSAAVPSSLPTSSGSAPPTAVAPPPSPGTPPPPSAPSSSPPPPAASPAPSQPQTFRKLCNFTVGADLSREQIEAIGNAMLAQEAIGNKSNQQSIFVSKSTAGQGGDVVTIFVWKIPHVTYEQASSMSCKDTAVAITQQMGLEKSPMFAAGDGFQPEQTCRVPFVLGGEWQNVATDTAVHTGFSLTMGASRTEVHNCTPNGLVALRGACLFSAVSEYSCTTQGVLSCTNSLQDPVAAFTTPKCVYAVEPAYVVIACLFLLAALFAFVQLLRIRHLFTSKKPNPMKWKLFTNHVLCFVLALLWCLHCFQFAGFIPRALAEVIMHGVCSSFKDISVSFTILLFLGITRMPGQGLWDVKVFLGVNICNALGKAIALIVQVIESKTTFWPTIAFFALGATTNMIFVICIAVFSRRLVMSLNHLKNVHQGSQATRNNKEKNRQVRNIKIVAFTLALSMFLEACFNAKQASFQSELVKTTDEELDLHSPLHKPAVVATLLQVVALLFLQFKSVGLQYKRASKARYSDKNSGDFVRASDSNFSGNVRKQSKRVRSKSDKSSISPEGNEVPMEPLPALVEV